MTFAPPSRRGLLALLLVVLALWFANLDYRKLVKPDEGRYAEIPREMVASGDWVTPRLNGVKYFEKPALQYWATAAAYEAFGLHEWTARLWPALTGLLGVLLAWYTGRRLFGSAAGLYAAAVLGSSLLYVLIGHINTLDMGVTFFMFLGLAGFLLAQHDGATPREQRRWMLATWGAMACAMLSKGLIGVALPGAVLVLYTLVQRDWRLWTRLHLLPGLALFLLLTVPWFVLVTLKNPEFLHFFFIHEHFERFLTKVHGRFQPWYYFVPILAAGLLPWLITALDALVRGWKARPGRFQPRRFLVLWTVFIYAFFTLSSSKLPSYILPIFPALALLAGERLATMKGRTLAWQVAPVVLLAALALWLIPGVVEMADEEVPEVLYRAYQPWLYAAAGLALAGGVAAVILAARNRVRPAVLALALAGLGSAQLTLTGHESLSPASSAYHLVQRIQPYLKPGIPFYSVGMYEQTLPFYIRRTVTVVEWQDELEFGFEQEPGKWIPKTADFIREWRAQPEALAILSPYTHGLMEQTGLPMETIARDTRRVVVRKP